MADEQVITTGAEPQHDVEMDNGVIFSGVGGDPEAMRIQFDEREEARAETKTPVETKAPATEKADDKRPSRGKQRFADLTREREDAMRRAEAADARAKELEAENAALKAKPAAAVATTREPDVTPPARVEPKAPVVAQPTRPKPLSSEIGIKYADYEAFVEDLADWKTEQREGALRDKLLQEFDARSQASIEAERATRNRQDRANDAFTRGRDAYPDFDAVISSADAILIPPAYQDAILSSPDAEHVLYALGKDHTKLQTLLKITDGVKLGMELARLVPSAAVASPASTAPVVRTTHAAPPPQPVTGSARTTSPTAEELAAKGDYEAYKALRNKQRAS